MRAARLGTLVVLVAAALGILAVLLSVASVRLGPAIDSVSTAQVLDGTAVDTRIGITFTESMNTQSVEQGFRIRPSVRGRFDWSGNQFLFTPNHPLRYRTAYVLTISPSARGITGKHLFRTFRRVLRTQSRQLVYLGTEGPTNHRLVVATVNDRHSVIGNDDGSVTGFSLSFDRTLLVYVRHGRPGERANELWLASLADGSTQRVFQHSDWTVSQPHFSPDGNSIVFLATNVRICQRGYPCFRDTTGPIIYVLDLRTRKVTAFHPRSDVPLTNFIDFSPRGQIAYTDLGSALTLASPSGAHPIHIPNRGNSLIYSGFSPTGDKAAFVGQTPYSTGGDVLVYNGNRYLDVSKGVYDSSTPAFSNDGQQLAYAAYRGEAQNNPVYGINVFNFKTRTTKRVTSERQWSDWSPQWSTDNQYLAFVRSAPQESMYMGSGEIWIVKSNGKGAHPIGARGTEVHWL